ncbi:MAG: hypothetical protein AB7E60_12015 [Sphingobium sp.]
MLAACDGREESALDNLADGANATIVRNQLKAEAEAVMEPLAPPPPGTPGGLPALAEPVTDKAAIDPDGAGGARQVVEDYYGLLKEQRFADAQDLWAGSSEIGAQDEARFAARFRGFSEIHANIGVPTDPEGAAGSLYVQVPVQVYGRLAVNGKPWYRLRQVTLRRVNDVPGASVADRRWHIADIGPYEPPQTPEAEVGVTEKANTLSVTDAMIRKPSP